MKLKLHIFIFFVAFAVTVSADQADDNIYYRMIDDAQHAINNQDFERGNTVYGGNQFPAGESKQCIADVKPRYGSLLYG